MQRVRTLEERRRDRIAAIERGVEAMTPRLAEYARPRGGRFILFGSAATGQLHDQSDIDLIADFPEDQAIEACAFADGVCGTLGLVGDVRPAMWTADKVLRRALETGRIIA